MKKWKESEIYTDSLWLIAERSNIGKHSGFYHGNFVPQIPRQLILRYTKKGDVVFDPFVGSGTTAYESESLCRNFIGIDIQESLITRIRGNINQVNNFSRLINADSTDEKTFTIVRSALEQNRRTKVQLALLHPPYADIIKFSDLLGDLSNTRSTKEFLRQFSMVAERTLSTPEF